MVVSLLTACTPRTGQQGAVPTCIVCRGPHLCPGEPEGVLWPLFSVAGWGERHTPACLSLCPKMAAAWVLALTEPQ